MIKEESTDQITITRKEFKEKIVKNPKSYGVVRALREEPKEKQERYGVHAYLEELAMMLALKDIEMELFGPEE